VVLNEAVTSGIPGGEKYALMASWDSVLGLDLERTAIKAWQPTEEILDLVRQRDEARQNKDFAAADRIREVLQSMGLEVMDTPDGTKVRPHASTLKPESGS
jgi:cysteinyl-tRNA synthetase